MEWRSQPDLYRSRDVAAPCYDEVTGSIQRVRRGIVPTKLPVVFPPPCGEGGPEGVGWGYPAADPVTVIPPPLIPPHKGEGDDCAISNNKSLPLPRPSCITPATGAEAGACGFW